MFESMRFIIGVEKEDCGGGNDNAPASVVATVAHKAIYYTYFLESFGHTIVAFNRFR